MKVAVGVALAGVVLGTGLLVAWPKTPAALVAAPANPAPVAMAAASAPDAAAAPVRQQVAAARLPTVVEARLVPEHSVAMGFGTSGTVSEVLVKEGDVVQAGAPLARLDERMLALEVDEALADLDAAKADYDRAAAGATPATVQQQQARLERARAALAVAQAEVTRQDIAAVQARIEESQLRLKRLESSPSADAMAELTASLDEAQLALQAASTRYSAEKTRQELEVEDYANRLRDLQDTYRRVVDDNAAKGDLAPADVDREASARRAMENATRDLQQQRVLLDQARQTEDLTIRAAEARVHAVEARLRQQQAGPSDDEIAEARASQAAAQADLARLQGAPRTQELALAESEVRVAEADLARITEEVRPVDLAIYEARIRQAEVRVKQSQLAQERATLAAPWAGTVAAVDLRVGDTVGPDQRDLLVLADLSSWTLETNDLSELSVAQISEGDRVSIGFYAVPDLKLPGTVTSIRPLGNAIAGKETTYAIVVTPDQADARLRWNMTATVSILPAASAP